jgi:aspartyl-tRNA synthetase
MVTQGLFPRCMEIGPVFKAEKSIISRHLTEFTNLNLKIEVKRDYHEVVDLLEILIVFIFQDLKAV